MRSYSKFYTLPKLRVPTYTLNIMDIIKIFDSML